MDVNEVVLYCIIIAGSVLAYLEFAAHKQQKYLLSKLHGTKERLTKLTKLVEEVEKVEYQMHKAAIEKVDRRNLDLIMKETLQFIKEKQVG